MLSNQPRSLWVISVMLNQDFTAKARYSLVNVERLETLLSGPTVLYVPFCGVMLLTVP